jgi:maltose alpha-D-glucosyltransferase/alpha-amylase
VRFPNVPAFAGGIEYRRNGSSEPTAVAIFQKFIPNQGVAWKFFLDAIGGYFERVLARKKDDFADLPKTPPSIFDITSAETPPLLNELIGGGPMEMVGLLGRRTAELHRALASADIRDFAPEPFSVLYQRSLYQSMQSMTKRVLQLLRRSLQTIPEDALEDAQVVIGMEKRVLAQLRAIHQKKLSAMKTRVHGDFHLGQVLFTGKDFVIIDFEGEPARPMGERRLKRSPLVDVAGMIRSFHYAAYNALLKGALLRPEDRTALEPWADMWYRYVGGVYLSSYLATSMDAQFLPRGGDELNVMLRAFLLEKAIYELGYELNNRPEWVLIPLKGIKQLMEGK